MPKFKDISIVGRNDAGVAEALKLSVHVNSEGIFYTTVPAHLHDSFQDRTCIPYITLTADTFKVQAKTFERLVAVIREAHGHYLTPVITREPVIHYNIESDVSFAMDEAGNIFPNAGYPGAKWLGEDRKLYGDHHATNPCVGGFSLRIGAFARMKITHQFGNTCKVEYEIYNGTDGNRHSGSVADRHPAGLLNSWCSIHLKDFKEIPYSDQAALFFHKLLMGMAEMSRRVQEATFTPEKVLALIEQSANIKLLGSV